MRGNTYVRLDKNNDKTGGRLASVINAVVYGRFGLTLFRRLGLDVMNVESRRPCLSRCTFQTESPPRCIAVKLMGCVSTLNAMGWSGGEHKQGWYFLSFTRIYSHPGKVCLVGRICS